MKIERDVERYRVERMKLGEKYCSTLVDNVTHKMSDEDFLKYVEITVHFQVLSGEHPIGKMGFALNDALKERSIEYIDKLVNLLSGLKESILGLEGSEKERAQKAIEYFKQIARLRAIERRYGLEEEDHDNLKELFRKIKNPEDLVNYYRSSAMEIFNRGFYPRILDYGVDHGHITEKIKKEIIIEGEQFKPRERRN